MTEKYGLWDAKDLAEAGGLAKVYILDLIRAGKGPSIARYASNGRTKLFDPLLCQQWLEARRLRRTTDRKKSSTKKLAAIEVLLETSDIELLRDRGENISALLRKLLTNHIKRQKWRQASTKPSSS